MINKVKVELKMLSGAVTTPYTNGSSLTKVTARLMELPEYSVYGHEPKEKVMFDVLVYNKNIEKCGMVQGNVGCTGLAHLHFKPLEKNQGATYQEWAVTLVAMEWDQNF